MKFFNQYRGLNKEIYILCIGRVISALGTFIWPLMSFILANKFGLKISQISILLVLGYSMSVPAILSAVSWPTRSPARNSSSGPAISAC